VKRQRGEILEQMSEASFVTGAVPCVEGGPLLGT
jgi:hypothetical protein